MISLAKEADASIVHQIMRSAFSEYQDKIPPSSALDETVQSVSESIQNGENVFIAYDEKEPVGMVRFKQEKNALYFYRLSVVPEKQGKGVAKKLLKSLEETALKKNINEIQCKVRMDVQKNVVLYSSLGYTIFDEEVVHKPNGIKLHVVSMKKEL